MSNFTFLKQNPHFHTFADAAVTAERAFALGPDICIVSCRMALESAVKWMYSVDNQLPHPYDDKLVTLIEDENFRELVDSNIWQQITLIRKLGNQAAHNAKKVTQEQAALCVRNLFYFMDFIATCYQRGYDGNEFDPGCLLPKPAAPDLDALIAENKELKAQLTALREAQKPAYIPQPLELTEYDTRKVYIDAMLLDAGWTRGQDWFDEVPLTGMPNQSGTGRADYVLYDSRHCPLAVIEAKRTCADVARGRQEAKLYADCLEKQYGRRPVTFLTNGFDTRIEDGQYPERTVSGIYSKRDLEKLFNLRSLRKSLASISISDAIANRYYQKGAIRAVCDTFDSKNRRKALLVMATGSGKTRTIIALCDVLLKHNWIQNILFLADRNSLVTQAKRAFVNLMPDLSVTNLCEDKSNYNARCVFSTYQTMYNVIDTASDSEGKLFSCGHFDLLICDEAHRSIYNKYRDIFNYFDAALVGLTATPKDEIDKNTYEIFELASGVPTYGYELSQAVTDGYLVDFLSVETKLKFLEEGIIYDDLSDEDKAAYEDTFGSGGELPESISSAALNEWVFNEDTIRQVLDTVMKNGLHINYGQTLGKTIIFAKNHAHAEKILQVFNKEYPHLNHYAKVIDNYTSYAQSAIDEFSDPKKLPQIAISVDMLDTGIDVPEVLNLVFFKKVLSKAKFWQMIGRGTRLCPGLIDGVDKDKFYIFDFCGNFDFFRMNQGKAASAQIALQGAIFNLKAQMVFKLQNTIGMTDDMAAFRQSLIDDLVRKTSELNRSNFAVKQHLKYVERFSKPEGFQSLTYEDTLLLDSELAPLITPDDDDPKAVRFDALLYGIELASLDGKKYRRARNDLLKKAQAIADVPNIPAIMAQSELLDKLLHTDYLETAGIRELEHIRDSLRDLVKYIPTRFSRYDTNFDDKILSIQWNEANLENDDLKNYRAKTEFYIREHQDVAAIAKLKGNVPLSQEDIQSLEHILWTELGTRTDYEAEYGEKPLGVLVREIVGLDMNAAKEAFAQYLNDASLNSNQIYFINQIIEYIVRNGMMNDLTVLQAPPFTDHGSIIEIFTDLTLWAGIRGVIEQINQNAISRAA